MKIIHTSDWHLGQLFHGYDRSNEHQAFLDWLLDELEARQPDALLIAGDIFDHANPSGQSQGQYYRFLASVRAKCPRLDIVIIAGNHDSAGRLEAPQNLLEALGIRVVGQIQPSEKPDRAIIPLRNADNEIQAWCLGLPYLRPGDVPRLEGERQNYVHGIAETYRAYLEVALERREPNQALIAMGHLHAQGGKTSEDSERRLVIGGEEAIDAGIFGNELAYVALGHLHLAQPVGDRENVRYCGSPLPLSFTETHYPHQILEVHLEGHRLVGVEPIPVPRAVPMLRIPEKPKPLDEVLEALRELKTHDSEAGREPWLEVQVLLEGPEPGLRQKIEDALADKPVRLVKISPTRKTADAAGEPKETEADLELKLEQPDRMFIRRYQSEWGHEPERDLLELFRELEDAARQEETA